MNIAGSTGDDAALQELGQRLAQYRLNQNLSQAELGKRAGVSRNTITRMEAGESTQAANLIRTLRALGLLQNLDALVPEPQVSPLQLASRQGKARIRARRSQSRPAPKATDNTADAATLTGQAEKKPWQWDDDA
jgi:transcriptional regulator with XRE-family HTH domain